MYDPMGPITALQRFLVIALSSRWRDRYVGFVGSRKNVRKFRMALPHVLHGCFDERCLVKDLPEVAWNAPGYRFSSYDGFGVVVESLRAEHSEHEASVLVISQDGRFGFHREETGLDLELRIDTSCQKPAGRA